MRIEPRELAELSLPPPQRFAVPANTLVVADTCGFHGRCPSSKSGRRVEIWAYSRRNPFLPWTGLDIFSLPGIASRRIGALWLDRKIVVSGKRVSVRVDLGGLRIIKKKKNRD